MWRFRNCLLCNERIICWPINSKYYIKYISDVDIIKTKRKETVVVHKSCMKEYIKNNNYGLRSNNIIIDENIIQEI